jgi:hypothetical protein
MGIFDITSHFSLKIAGRSKSDFSRFFLSLLDFLFMEIGGRGPRILACTEWANLVQKTNQINLNLM